MNIELFIAQRLYKARKGGKRVSRPATTIAQWGVSVGLVVMMLSVAIVVGFKNEVRNKIIGFGGHIQINSYTAAENEQPFVIADSSAISSLLACDGVTKVETYIQRPGLLAVGEEFEGVMLKGIDTSCYPSFFAENMKEGKIPTPDDSIKETHWVVLSKAIAEKAGCSVGDKINVYFMHTGIKARRMVVAGIYETHLYEMDNIYALTDIETLRRLNGWSKEQVSNIEITTDNYEKLEERRLSLMPVATQMANRNNQELYVQTIEELSPALFAWLGILDRTVWVILILVLGIAGFTMVSGLLIIILEKSNLIGVLKAVGAQNLSIRKIFLYYSSFIIGRGMIWGNIIAIALCLLQQYTGIIKLDPEMYYMNCVPIEFSWVMIPMNILMFIISVAMLVVPSMLISRIEPSKAIKFE